MKAQSLTVTLTVIFVIVTGAFADVPDFINYQGTLTDSSGNPISGTVSITLSFYNNQTGGFYLWTETHSTVEVVNGLFHLQMGSVTPLSTDMFTGQDLWLETGVASETLSPRASVGKVAYGQKSAVADYATLATYADTAQFALNSGTDNDWVLSGDDIYRLNGNVGIGTSSPAYKLDVDGYIKAGDHILVGGNIIELNPGFVAGNLRYQSNKLSLYGGMSGISLHGADTNPKVTMTTDGDVGIGTTTPQYKLDVNGYIYTSDHVGVGGNIIELNPGFVAGNLRYQSNKLSLYGGMNGISLHGADTNPKVTMTTDGDVGIGTTTPQYKLDVNGYIYTSDHVGVGGNIIELNPGFVAGNLRYQSNKLSLYGGMSGISFHGADTNPKVTMTTDGDVGIGTTTPSYKLDVEGDIECTALHETSDDRLKTNISTLSNALNKVDQLRGVSFEWNEEAEAIGASTGKKQIGVLASEVEQVFPELVSTPENGYKSVDYTKLTAVLIEAVKELKAHNDKLRAENNTLKEDLSTITNDIKVLKELILN